MSAAPSFDNPEHRRLADQLCACAGFFAARGLCPATGGNFSVRHEPNAALITASGVDKGALSPVQLLPIRLDGELLADGKPSAETGLHLALYRRDPAIGAILHVHSIANTLLSRIGQPSALVFEGYEMQKAISGQADHLGRLVLPVVDNSQDMDTLAAAVDVRFDEIGPVYAFLVRGHGIYAWGTDIVTAQRHLEGWEFLLACELQRRQLETRT